MHYPPPAYAVTTWVNPTTGLIHVCLPPAPGESRGRHEIVRTPAELVEVLRTVEATANARRSSPGLVGRLTGPYAEVEFDLTGGQYHQLRKPDTTHLVEIARAAIRQGKPVRKIAAGRSGLPEAPAKPRAERITISQALMELDI